MAEPELLHLVFVHGFQGDHTSFRSFPKDLHESLSPKLAARFPQIELKSSIYPTYKTRKLVTEASRALSIWLASQAPARFILFGHSMGGLVIAEAATVFQKVHKQRIFAVVAIDTPFLGMHPHVIISGLASLLPKGGEGHKSEREMNANSEVHMVTEGDIRRAESVLSAGRRAELDSLQVTRPVQPKPRKEISEWESYKRSPSPSPRSASPDFMEQAVSFFEKKSEARLARFLAKHRDDPIGAMQHWVVEHFMFGSLMFDPSELLRRYRLLEAWDGYWINYWTATGSDQATHGGRRKPQKRKTIFLEGKEVDLPSSTAEFVLMGSGSDTDSINQLDRESIANEERSNDSEDGLLAKLGCGCTSSKSLDPEIETVAHVEKPAEGASQQVTYSNHHFITLPPMSSHGANYFDTTKESVKNWERIYIRRAPDEVVAHQGIFHRDTNPDYDEFVVKVGDQIERWLLAGSKSK